MCSLLYALALTCSHLAHECVLNCVGPLHTFIYVGSSRMIFVSCPCAFHSQVAQALGRMRNRVLSSAFQTWYVHTQRARHLHITAGQVSGIQWPPCHACLWMRWVHF